jgi:hypothetical protein
MYLTIHTSLSPIRLFFAPSFVKFTKLGANPRRIGDRLTKLQKRCTRLAAASDKVYQLLAHGRWFSPRTPASSTTKTGRRDIAESCVKHQKSINQSVIFLVFCVVLYFVFLCPV